jgi:hypothetical protein
MVGAAAPLRGAQVTLMEPKVRTILVTVKAMTFLYSGQCREVVWFEWPMDLEVVTWKR